MRRTLVGGGLVAVAAGLLAVHGGHLGIEATRIALFGVVTGAVLGLAGEASPAGRSWSFAAGFTVTWVAYALRAAVLPDIPLGRGVAAFLVVAAVTAVAAVSRDRLPLWSGLLGAGLMAGAYETAFTLSPPTFATESVTAATGALVTAGLGYLVAIVVRETAPASPPPPGEIDLTAAAAIPAQRTATTDAPIRTEV